MHKYITLLFSPRGMIGRKDFLIGNISTFVVTGLSMMFFYWVPSFLASRKVHELREMLDFSALSNVTDSISSSDHRFLVMNVILLYLPIIIFYAIPNLFLCIKRIRDIGLSAWLAALIFVPYIGFAARMILLFYPSKNESRAALN